MEKLRRAVIKEEFYAITEDTTEATILNQFVYWSERVRDYDKFIKEEMEIYEKYKTEETPEINMPLRNGWIYKKTTELKEEIMASESETTIRRRIKSLVEKGFLDERHNPIIKYDRTMQYRVNLINIAKAMYKKGYVLQDYKLDLSFIQNELSNIHSEESKNQNESLKNQNEFLKEQLEELKKQNEFLKNQFDGAIPKTTTETTKTETTKTESISESEKNPSALTYEDVKNYYEKKIKPLEDKEIKFKDICIQCGFNNVVDAIDKCITDHVPYFQCIVNCAINIAETNGINKKQ